MRICAAVLVALGMGVQSRISTTTDSARIVGGTVVDNARFPYFTALFSRSASNSSVFSFCGGSLIREDCVITAAHCLSTDYLFPDVIVNFTGFDYMNTGTTYARTVSRIVIHPDYDSETIRNDIALVFLDSPVIGIAPLAMNNNVAVPTEGDFLTAIGAGRVTESEALSSHSELRQVNLPFVNAPLCAGAYYSSNGFVIDQNVMLCAGYTEGGKGACQGDSGGPYVIMGDSPEEDVLVAITSFGEGCARAGLPDVATRVSAFQEWIACVENGTCAPAPAPSEPISAAPPKDGIPTTSLWSTMNTSNVVASSNPMLSIVLALLLAIIFPLF